MANYYTHEPEGPMAIFSRHSPVEILVEFAEHRPRADSLR